ncbi:MAG TPA: DUF3857 domain-containing protein [Chitinophagaceae bacterium]|nr:DUF3857 domain-containing protein [Chitinophagaceae bacterium]
MVKIIFLLAAMAVFGTAGAQGYSVSLIDPALMKDANVVMRFEEDRYEMKGMERMSCRYKRVVTILNEKGDDHAGLVVHYDSFHEIEYIEGTLYDINGKKIRSLKKGEIRDQSGTGSDLANDDRYKVHHFYHRVYPYTVEYEYAVTRKQTMSFPNWFTQVDQFYAVEESRFVLVVPTSYQFRYKAFNYPGNPEITTQSDKTVYQWTAKKLPPIQYAYGFPGWRYISPMVITGPTDFQFDDYKGKLNNWGEFGNFIQALIQGRDMLPDPVKQQVHALIAGKQSTREKVEVLYEYLQKNTRYISIQFGVGGLRPFEAGFVAKNKYGDCKALSNYMYALLKEAGIPSHYTIVRAGDDEEDIVNDFPSNQFNHVILCVPVEKDTVWLECTSQDQVPGYMGSFTGNRHALLVTSEGGKLVRTPFYGIRENHQVSRVKAVVEENGNLSVEQSADYSGLLQELHHDLINSLSKDKVKEFLNQSLDLATYDILDFKYEQDRKQVPVVHEQLKLVVNNYVQISGKRIFVTPNISNRFHIKLTQEDRKYPIKLWHAFVEVDSVEIAVPGGYKTEAMPNPVQVESKFGKYTGSYKVDNNKIYYYRRFERYNGIFENTLYPELVKFYEQVYKADRNRIVLVKSE